MPGGFAVSIALQKSRPAHEFSINSPVKSFDLFVSYSRKDDTDGMVTALVEEVSREFTSENASKEFCQNPDCEHHVRTGDILRVDRDIIHSMNGGVSIRATDHVAHVFFQCPSRFGFTTSKSRNDTESPLVGL